LGAEGVDSLKSLNMKKTGTDATKNLNDATLKSNAGTSATESLDDDHFGRGNYTTWIGIRADETKRLKPKPGIRYLAELSDFEKSD
ncbi:hypothetical protein MJL81_29575, partial [Salmonella enterica subsp. enterica serovar Anatum]|nr:hypothetical protein [Salmonella enterica subsp. enterica serovar Anatum]